MNKSEFKNIYYLLRHGISKANEAGLIVSRPENGILDQWGLSAAGVQDTKTKLSPQALAVRGLDLNAENCIVISSDFSRALQTAQIFCQSNALPEPIIEVRLRERSFGVLELQSHENYQKVWDIDAQTENTRAFDCESTKQVALRLQALLQDCESKYNNKNIVMVSHGDPSQIMQTIVMGLRPNQHRTLAHLENAELRLIVG